VDNDLAQDRELLDAFLIEAREGLEQMDRDMVALESDPDGVGLLNRVFRTMHTIKGAAGFFGFEPVTCLCHHAESVLQAIRCGEIELKPVADALLKARDALGEILGDLAEGVYRSYDLDSVLRQLQNAREPHVIAPPLGELLVQQGIISQTSLDAALAEQAARPEAPRLGTVLIERGLASPVQVGDALLRQKELAHRAHPAPTVRIEVGKLDELLKIAGDIGGAQDRLAEISRDFAAGHPRSSELDDITAHFQYLIERLRISMAKIRVVSIDCLFRKLPRVVHDIGNKLGKQVELVTSGQDIEIDRAMVERLGDSLLHLVRNSLDHGIETPELRIAAGKPSKGTIRLCARQQEDQIVITVSDDGAGIDPERIARKAVALKQASPETIRGLNPKEVLQYVFRPGFTTRELVNDLSGRGVGLDVAKTNVLAINGTIELDSELHQGTWVTIYLPLALKGSTSWVSRSGAASAER